MEPRTVCRGTSGHLLVESHYSIYIVDGRNVDVLIKSMDRPLHLNQNDSLHLILQMMKHLTFEDILQNIFAL